MSPFEDSEVCRGILEVLPLGLCVLDGNHRIVIWSEGAERITGRLRHEVVGRSCISEPLLHCDRPGCEFCREDCPAARAMKTSRPCEARGFVRHKSGYELPVQIRAVAVHNAHGSIIGVAETFEERRPCTAEAASDDHRDGSIDVENRIESAAIMKSHLIQALKGNAESQLSFGVLLFRLEGLEHFRAAFGTEAASSLLQAICRTIEGAIWKTDCAGRWADDQFLVLLNGCREESLYSVRERLRRMLALDSIEWWGERRSVPITVAQTAARPDDTLESLLQRLQNRLEAASEQPISHAESGGSIAPPGAS